MITRKYIKVACLFVVFGFAIYVEIFRDIRPVYSQPSKNATVWMLDPSFGNLGIFSYSPNYPIVSVQYYRMHLLNDGRMVIPYIYDWNDGSFNGTDYIVILVDSNGELEQILPWYDVVAVQSDDKLIVWEYNNGNPILKRYFPDFTPDPSFSTPLGVVVCCSWVVQPDDKILMGSSQGGNIARLNSDGSLDNSFPGDVGPFNRVESLTAHENDGFLVQEWFTTPLNCSARSYDEFAVLIGYLYNTPSFLPENFCHSHIQFSSYPGDGYVWIDWGDTVYRSSGSGQSIFQTDVQSIIDQSYGSNWLHSGPSPIAVQLDGKILFSGLIQNDSLNYWYMTRLNADGTADDVFGNQGVYAWDTNNTFIGNLGSTTLQEGLFILPEGQIIVIGSAVSSLNIARLFEMQIDTTLYFPILSK